ncbi:hypothetical protein Acr_21g0007150 [Actinidia rufa]|uniref:Uncharacterized protein n=1 Tax=Actinidia rufa TaxID=165716 RepID=A0A7J0GH35_9ERIC|nr:hypothetical protein Acr_21g0007150 [Actinidia rufa]
MMASGPSPDTMVIFLLGLVAGTRRGLSSAMLLLRRLNNCDKTWKVEELLNYMTTYHHIIPHRDDKLGQVRLPPLRKRASSSPRFNTRSTVGLGSSLKRAKLSILPKVETVQREGPQGWSLKEKEAGGRAGSVDTSSLNEAPSSDPQSLLAFELKKKVTINNVSMIPASLGAGSGDAEEGHTLMIIMMEHEPALVRAANLCDNKATKALLKVTVSRERMDEVMQELTELKEEEYVNHPAEDEVEGDSGVGHYMAINKLGEEVGTNGARDGDPDIPTDNINCGV